MKKLILGTFFALIASISYAKSNNDYFLLNDGKVVYGNVLAFKSNSFIVNTDYGKIKIKNDDVSLVAIGQDLSAGEKMRLGMLDGKRYAKNKGGNLAVGFFFGIIGTAIVYIASDQTPSWEASNGPNKAIVNDSDYMTGYSKGAKSKSGGQAAIGSLIWIALLLI